MRTIKALFTVLGTVAISACLAVSVSAETATPAASTTDGNSVVVSDYAPAANTTIVVIEKAKWDRIGQLNTDTVDDKTDTYELDVNDLMYLDQYTTTAEATEGLSSIGVKTKLAENTDYYVLLNDPEASEITKLTFKYTTKQETETIQLGDVDGENGITTSDATMILDYIAKTIDSLTAREALAADVDRENGITTSDATMILDYIAKTIDSLETIEVPKSELE